MNQKFKKMRRDNIPIPDHSFREQGVGCSGSQTRTENSSILDNPTAVSLGEEKSVCPVSQTPSEISAHPKFNVVNLSDVPLIESELKLISKGLTFCPCTDKFNEYQLYQDLDNFARNLRLREYSYDREIRQKKIPGASDKCWTPSDGRDKHLDMYISVVHKDVLNALMKTNPVRNNLSTGVRKALFSLGHGDDIAIMPADKGGTIVVINKTNFIREGLRALSDENFYEELPAESKQQFVSKITLELTRLLKIAI